MTRSSAWIDELHLIITGHRPTFTGKATLYPYIMDARIYRLTAQEKTGGSAGSRNRRYASGKADGMCRPRKKTVR
jgi:hypothetical protein